MKWNFSSLSRSACTEVEGFPSLELLVNLSRQIAFGVEKLRLLEKEKEVVVAVATEAAIDTIEALGDGLLLHSTDGTITGINPAFEK